MDDATIRPLSSTPHRRLADLRRQFAELPPRAKGSVTEQAERDRFVRMERLEREELLAECAADIYAELTDGFRLPLRAKELVFAAAEAFPGLTPSRADHEVEHARQQRHKIGLEIDQGIFLAHVLNDPRTGHHLIHSMSQPRGEALSLLERMRREDHVDLGLMSVYRRDNVGYVYIQNHDFLNAEDNESTAILEIATDLVLLDDRIEVGVLRGGIATHHKWRGRRVFGAGINLTHLYHGKISLVDFFVERELGPLNKMYRGHAVGSADPQGAEERHEKPWIAAVDSFAIGGGCQFLMVMDRVIAEPDSYMSLPALKEGLIPGCGNLRLPRFVGERLARQTIFFGRTIRADSEYGRLLVDETATSEDMDAAIARTAAELTSGAPSSLLTNRKAMRIGVESVDTFRRYMSTYVRDQAYNLHSAALIDNLERTWLAKSGVP